MSYFQRRDARRYPSSSIVLISLRGEQPVFPRLEAKNGQGASVCVLPVIRRKPEGFPALELVDEVQGDVLISLVRGGLDVVVHANGEITLFELQAGHTGPADGIRNGVADAVFGVNAGVGDSGLGLGISDRGDDGGVKLRLDVPAAGGDILGQRHARGELHDVLEVIVNAVQRAVVHFQIITVGMQGRVAHARMRHDVQPVSPELILAAQLGSKSAGLHVGIGIVHAERGGQIHVQAVAADAVAHGSKDVQAVAVPASVQVGSAEVVVVIRRGNGALAFRTAGSAVHGKAHAEHAASEPISVSAPMARPP